jgi:condensin complex subunit 2
MSLLKEGDGVNFQRASCTLDGCVKIYTNRVDSVATETGKLLSGLTESNQNSREKGEVGEDGDGENDGDDDDGDESGKKRSKKRVRVRRSDRMKTNGSRLNDRPKRLSLLHSHNCS